MRRADARMRIEPPECMGSRMRSRARAAPAVPGEDEAAEGMEVST